MSENEALVERLRVRAQQWRDAADDEAEIYGEGTEDQEGMEANAKELDEAAAALTAAEARIKMLSEALAGVMPLTSYGPEGKSPPDELASIAAGYAALAAIRKGPGE